MKKSTVSRQRRMSIRGSVKTSALGELEREKRVSLALTLSFLSSSLSWIGAVWDRSRPPSVSAERYFLISDRNRLTLPKLDVQMECSRLSLPHLGREDWSRGVRGHRCWIFKGNVLWLRRGLSSNKKTVRQFDSRLYSHSVQLRYKVGVSVSPPLSVSFNVTFV